uniref:ShKT domain-containing protein n=1 Tax=Ditylum brightwellii TaxID=49249 RepID=A0A6U3TZM8_9STRA|mmetsp:Transcript_38683/g.58065  ORF Transcript_38683/g.58065 Transcript_38683/m.58065 type:complete len:180 (+) Transcript_38683:67-606(+)
MKQRRTSQQQQTFHHHQHALHSSLFTILTFLILLFNILLSPVESRMCVAVEDDQYLCTDDVIGTLEASRNNGGGGAGTAGDSSSSENSVYNDRGVTQRVDGNEVEREAVRHILRQMENYFQNEVLSKPQYESVRGRCKNMNELCAFWASVGECESNRGFMLTNCAASCRLCLLLHTNLN